MINSLDFLNNHTDYLISLTINYSKTRQIYRFQTNPQLWQKKPNFQKGWLITRSDQVDTEKKLRPARFLEEKREDRNVPDGIGAEEEKRDENGVALVQRVKERELVTLIFLKK